MIIDTIQEWFKEVLIDGIISNLSGTFDTVNTKVAEIAGEVGMTPSGWNGGIFNMIRSLSETVIVPIAGIILTFVMCYELIQLIVEKNNLHDFDTWLFWKWIFKTFCAVLIVTNTWNIVMAVFDVAQSVVDQSAGVIISDAGIDISGVVGDLETTLADWSIGSLLGLWFQSVFVGLCSHILTIAIFLVIYGRMIEVYLTVSVGPIPFATMVNREWGHTGQNYLKSLLALGFQAFLIMVCVGIYAVLVQNIAVGDDITVAIWECMGYTVLLCYTLFKTGSLAKKPVRSALKEVSILAYVTVPKDLTKIKSKMLFGLTKRQLVCFGSAALVGVPLFFLSKGSMGTTSAALCMILVMLPFFLFALYEKNGQTLEVILGHLIQCKFIRPKRRIYQTNNAYSALVRQAKLEKEVRAIAEKNGKTGKLAARRKA